MSLSTNPTSFNNHQIHNSSDPMSFTDKYFNLKSGDPLSTTIKKITCITLSLATFGLFLAALITYDYFANRKVTAETQIPAPTSIPTEHSLDQAGRDDKEVLVLEETPSDITLVDAIHSTETSHEGLAHHLISPPQTIQFAIIDCGAGSQIGQVTLLRLNQTINLSDLSEQSISMLNRKETKCIIFELEDLKTRLRDNSPLKSKNDSIEIALQKLYSYLEVLNNKTTKFLLELNEKLENKTLYHTYMKEYNSLAQIIMADLEINLDYSEISRHPERIGELIQSLISTEDSKPQAQPSA
jgi:hypothetical protein